MRNLLISAAFVAFSHATRQDDFDYGLDNRNEVVDGMDYVWTDVQIEDFVDTEFGGNQWSFIEDQLMTDYSKELLVTDFVTSMVSQWSMQAAETLPAVCDAGLACREKKFTVAMGLVTDEWASLMDTIDSIMVSTISQVETLTEEAHIQAYECEPGCTCDNIMIEYNDVIRVQQDLVKKIVTSSNTIQELKVEETEIIEICPNYAALDSDGVYNEDSMVEDTSSQVIQDILYPPTVGEDEDSWAPVEPIQVENMEEIIEAEEIEDFESEAIIVGEDEDIREPIVHWLPTIGPENDHIDLYTSTTFKQVDLPEVKNYDNPVIRVCSDNDECKFQFTWLDGTKSGADLTASPTCYDIPNGDGNGIIDNVEIGYYHVRASYYEDQMYLSSMEFKDEQGNRLWRSQSCDWDDFTDPSLGYRNSFLNFDMNEGDRLVGYVSNYYIPEGEDGMYNFHWSVGSLPDDE